MTGVQETRTYMLPTMWRLRGMRGVAGIVYTSFYTRGGGSLIRPPPSLVKKRIRNDTRIPATPRKSHREGHQSPQGMGGYG